MDHETCIYLVFVNNCISINVKIIIGV